MTNAEQPILRPRLMLGMAMAIFSFAMLVCSTRTLAQQIHPADFNLLNMWNAGEDKVTLVTDQAIDYCDNIRIVYRVLRGLNELQKQEISGKQRTGLERHISNCQATRRCQTSKHPLLFETSERGLPLFGRWDPNNRPRL